MALFGFFTRAYCNDYILWKIETFISSIVFWKQHNNFITDVTHGSIHKHDHAAGSSV